ncbi:hypothetical protein MYX82_04440 [Acidobacteria bacterium AH-259-D05]|nr:hypothetical protein [Acidobacteria bacterium AH-259-D05]
MRKRKRDELLIELLEPGKGDCKARGGGKLAQFVNALRPFLILQPNFFGLGINIDELLKKFEDTEEERERSHQDG